MSSKGLKHNSQMVCMVILTMGIDKDIINENYEEQVQVLFENPIHQVHESYRGICKSKRQLEIQSDHPSSEVCLRNVTFSDSKMMISRFEVYLREIIGTLQLVEESINFREWILVLDCDFVQLSVADTHSERIVFLMHELD
ncbi:hypothetical protein CQW23_19353 [Capsicum baccatum]|uniref:Uncharacterized protein n=1 Tax=Capsicum baccatum TaxID=33114 RepID=A0A2G2W5M0_CAPBA|nr:hypothetical protein CQW23_19353 [Capsicum baccatum]